VLALDRGTNGDNEVMARDQAVNIQIVRKGEGFSSDVITQRCPRTLSVSPVTTVYPARSTIATSTFWKK
jgi:hypothetical protein